MMKTLLEPDASGDKMCIDTAPDAVKNLICLSPLPKLMNIGQNPFSTPENLVQGGRNGLPIGLQIVGKPFQESTVLSLGQAFESSTDFHQHHPDLSFLGLD